MAGGRDEGDEGNEGDEGEGDEHISAKLCFFARVGVADRAVREDT